VIEAGVGARVGEEDEAGLEADADAVGHSSFFMR
jgi:hypothetical protein